MSITPIIPSMGKKEAAIDAIEKAGGPAELARKLLGDDCTKEDFNRMQWRISKWQSEQQGGIPPKYVLAVETISGVSRHKLAPDIYPAPTVAA